MSNWMVLCWNFNKYMYTVEILNKLFVWLRLNRTSKKRRLFIEKAMIDNVNQCIWPKLHEYLHFRGFIGDLGSVVAYSPSLRCYVPHAIHFVLFCRSAIRCMNFFCKNLELFVSLLNVSAFEARKCRECLIFPCCFRDSRAVLHDRGTHSRFDVASAAKRGGPAARWRGGDFDWERQYCGASCSSCCRGRYVHTSLCTQRYHPQAHFVPFPWRFARISCSLY